MENNTKQQHTTITDDVLEKIRKGEVRMYSKVYVSLKVLLLIGIVFLTILTSALLISFIIFSIKISGQQFLLGFGWRGIQTFILMFPWRMLIIDIILIIVLETLIKRFKIGYRNSLISLVCGIFLFTLFLAFLIIVTPIHMILLHRAEHRQLPVFGSMYMHLRRQPREQGLFEGNITSLSGDMFILHHTDTNDDDSNLPTDVRVFAPSALHISSFLHVGDTVYVAGTPEKEGIHAYGISRVDPVSE